MRESWGDCRPNGKRGTERNDQAFDHDIGLRRILVANENHDLLASTLAGLSNGRSRDPCHQERAEARPVHDVIRL